MIIQIMMDDDEKIMKGYLSCLYKLNINPQKFAVN